MPTSGHSEGARYSKWWSSPAKECISRRRVLLLPPCLTMPSTKKEKQEYQSSHSNPFNTFIITVLKAPGVPGAGSSRTSTRALGGCAQRPVAGQKASSLVAMRCLSKRTRYKVTRTQNSSSQSSGTSLLWMGPTNVTPSTSSANYKYVSSVLLADSAFTQHASPVGPALQ